MKPCPAKDLTDIRRIFNYRLSLVFVELARMHLVSLLIGLEFSANGSISSLILW